MIIDIDNSKIVDIFIHDINQNYLIASNTGKGFIIEGSNILSGSKSGKQIMNLDSDSALAKIVAIKNNDDAIAIIGNNRNLSIFELSSVPIMQKGRGVILQKYKDAKLSDILLFRLEDGLSWNIGNKKRIENDLRTWIGKRAVVGKMPPHGFPKNNKFK